MSNPALINFIQTCSAGDVKEFNKIFSSLSIEQKNEFVEFDHYACFHYAAANGHCDIVNAIFNYIKSVTNEWLVDEALIPVFSEREGEGFKAAIANHHIETVALILKQEFLMEECLDIIAENPVFIRTIWNSSLQFYIFMIFDKCCDNGKLDVVIFLWNLFTPQQKTKIIESQFSNRCIAASKQGHFEIIKQLALWVNPEQKILFLTDEDFSAFIYAADRGHIEIVRFILESLPTALQSEALSASNYAAYRLATRNKYTQLIDFLESYASENTIEKMKKAVFEGVFSFKNK